MLYGMGVLCGVCCGVMCCGVLFVVPGEISCRLEEGGREYMERRCERGCGVLYLVRTIVVWISE